MEEKLTLRLGNISIIVNKHLEVLCEVCGDDGHVDHVVLGLGDLAREVAAHLTQGVVSSWTAEIKGEKTDLGVRNNTHLFQVLHGDQLNSLIRARVQSRILKFPRQCKGLQSDPCA